jgi:hypothetical protein
MFRINTSLFLNVKYNYMFRLITIAFNAFISLKTKKIKRFRSVISGLNFRIKKRTSYNVIYTYIVICLGVMNMELQT